MVPPIIDMCRKHNIAATFFDLTTILSLKFRRKAVRWCELGWGELDSAKCAF